MPALTNQLLVTALDFGINEAQQYEAPILAELAAANVTLEGAVDLFIESIKLGGALGYVLPALKKAMIASANNAITTSATSQEKVVYDLIISAAKNEAAKLSS